MSTIADSVESVVSNHSFWKGLKPKYVQILSESASSVEFQIGQTIYNEGEPADHFYLIHRGRVALEAFIPGRGRITIQTICQGDALGWSWLFPPHRWHFSACAIDPVEAVCWDTNILRARAEDDHDFGYELMWRLAHVLAQRLHATRMQLVNFYDGHEYL